MHKIWHVDSSEYKSTYFQTVELSKRELHAEVSEKISIPEAVALPDEYTRQDKKLLIVGQETLGNVIMPLLGASPYRAWEQQMGGNVAFDYAYGGDRQARDSFWRAFEEIKYAFSLTTRRQIGCSNLLKVQLIEKIGKSSSVVCLPGGCMPIVVWQRALFQAEMKFFAPDAILFLTGDRTWVLDHMFDVVERQPIAGEGYSVVHIPELPIPMAQTYHLRAYNTRSPGTATARANAVTFLKSRLGLK